MTYAGAVHHCARFSPQEVREIRVAHWAGISLAELHRVYPGVTKVALWKIIHGVSWKSAGGPVAPITHSREK